MSKKDDNDKKGNLDSKIDELLTQQNELKEKISLLEEKKGTVRESVFNKVKNDYEERLMKIESQLKGQSSYMLDKYKKFKEDTKEIQGKKDEVESKIEETDLRHSVGEYSDEEYEKLVGDLKSELQGVEEQYNTLTKEMEKIKRILDTVGVNIAEEKIPQEGALTKEEEISIEKEKEETELPDVSEAEKLAEEIFSGDETTAETTEGVEAGKTEVSLPEGDDENWLEGLEKELSIGEEEESKGTEKKSEDKKKTETVEGIKCPKCGFINKPDAWYCEKCGAELSPEE